ncbi:MAG: hypothetical protein QOJ62_2785 [Actinomycetota bacterium]|nr:hypothetical protein [Actinomycetota bacterium]
MNDQTTDLGELVITRVFDAPRELVFRCMTEPQHLTHFWGPIGTTTPLDDITVDARPGGAFETVMVNDADGSRYPMRAVYVEIVKSERLVWTDPTSGMTTTSTFSDVDGSRTQVHIHQTNVPAFFRSADAQAGFSSSLDRFATYLGEISSGLPANNERPGVANSESSQ